MNVINRPFLPNDEKISGLAALSWLARAQALAHKSSAYDAENYLAAQRVPASIQRICKAAIGSSGLADANIGTGPISIADWSLSARSVSAFYRVWPDLVRVPANTRVAMITSSPSASVTPEAKGIPLGKVVLGNILLSWQKVTSMMAVTNELLYRVDAEGQTTFGRELLAVVAGGVDLAFVNKITQGLTPIASTAPMADVRSAMLAVIGSLNPRYYWLAASDTAKFAASLTTTKGGAAFSAAGAVDGTICGIPLLVSSALASGTLVLFDASQIAADAISPVVDVSGQADYQADTSPTNAADVPTGTTLVSAFQTNTTLLRAIAYLATDRLRTSAVSLVSGVSGTTWATT